MGTLVFWILIRRGIFQWRCPSAPGNWPSYPDGNLQNEHTKSIGNIILSLVSLLVSAVFVWAGGRMVSGVETPTWIRAFGVLTAIYGVGEVFSCT